ncbi:hypothetical protein QFX18_16905 [Saccharophagus degradans]|uniref:hypothetical protein n=1 Tax=Saccharophagus degradans TaxID=86304 RepID=UPI002478205F|nr:hypothetical protein [Saccharophagus degradans]WGO97692.1 hypothetical protein QFX18_16905 [Saccharophagus degradans]
MQGAVSWRALVVLGAMTLLVLCYWGGVAGPFILDDFGVIPKLGEYGGIKGWDSLAQYVLNGNTGPIGRPLTLLTFTANAQEWPANPFYFKLTNLFIHSLVGLIVFSLISNVLIVVRTPQRVIFAVSFVSASFWVLHPFLASTTLYVVQRMAQLSTLFVLLGLLWYIRCRQVYSFQHAKHFLFLFGGVGIFGVLGLLSKENAVLLPILICIIEHTVFASNRERFPPLSLAWRWLGIYAPSALIFIYLAKMANTVYLFEPMPPRGFSVVERVLTESRILVDYLRHWFIPSLYTSGVFHDYFEVSKGLLSPFTTLLSLVFHLFLLVVAAIYRKKMALFSLAVFFFYGAHLLESTVLMLELYFEHRNYLATVFLIVPLVYMLFLKCDFKMACLVSGLGLGVLAVFLRFTSIVWESYPSLVESAIALQPKSARAQQQYSMLLYNAGRKGEALSVVEFAISNSDTPTSALVLWELALKCDAGRLSEEELKGAAEILVKQPYDLREFSYYENLVDATATEGCAEGVISGLLGLVSRQFEHPLNRDEKGARFAQLKFLKGTLELRSSQLDRAVSDFEWSLSARPSSGTAMRIAALLAAEGRYEAALSFSETARTLLLKEEQKAGVKVLEADIEAFEREVKGILDLRGSNG